MDWLPILITLATASFLIPILKEYHKKSPVMERKLSALKTQIRILEVAIAQDKEQESAANAELKGFEKELAELDNGCHELRKLIDAKMRKR